MRLVLGRRVAVLKVDLVGEAEAELAAAGRVHLVQACHERVERELRRVGLELAAQMQPRALFELAHKCAVRALHAQALWSLTTL